MPPLLAFNLGGTTIGAGAMLGFFVWLGFMATITAAEISFQKLPWGLWVLNNAHNLLVQVIMAAIVTAWR